VAPLLTVLLALFISGIVVLLTTGSVGDTLETYRAIFRGSGRIRRRRRSNVQAP